MIPKGNLKRKENLTLQTFLWGVGLSFLIFLPWIILNKGYFFFYGDFNVQQIPFYQMIHDSILDGNIGWSYTTDLGANIIGSYSFYNIGSPFFWITLLFPSAAVPYLMAPLLMLKFGFASMGAYLFLRRYVNNQIYAMSGALLYAFSGFGIYNIFFNHFHEAMITFPLMLAAMDTFIYERRKGYLAFSVFAAAMVNYYFFAGQAVFIFIYWCFRMATGSYKMSILEFLRMAMEIIVGFLCAGAILVPSIFAVVQNSRLDNFPHGWGAIVYTNEQRYLHIILSFFFPPDMPAYANFTPDSNAKWASVAAWLPLFSMVGVFSFYRLNTHKWLRKLIPTLFVMAMVPILNCMFQLFNATYYARWFYMLTLMLAMATVISLDHDETEFKPALIRTTIITGAITALIGLVPEDSFTKKDSDHTLGLEKYPDRFWCWVGVAFVGLTALTILLCLRKNDKVFKCATAIALSVIIVGYGNLLVGVGVVNANYRDDFLINYALGNKGAFDDDLKDLYSVRSDYYEAMDNMGMYWQTPTIQAFQSIVPGSVMDFYPTVGVERSVGSRPEVKYYGLRSLLNVKYLFDYKDDGNQFRNTLDTTEMPGWEYILDKNDYKVYENKYYIPYGFTYDEYITRDEYDAVSESNRHLLLLKAMVLTDEQAEKYSDILKHHIDMTEFSYTENAYFDDCEERRKRTCSSVNFENNRITAEFTAGDKDELVYFSIPYEPGWSAEVNGEPVQIETVNIGFMAVRVPKGRTSEIVFTYKTPGLVPGIVVTIAGAVLLTVYMILWKNPTKRRRIYLNYIEDDTYRPDVPYDEALFEEYEDEKALFPLTSRVRVNAPPSQEEAEEAVSDDHAMPDENTQEDMAEISNGSEEASQDEENSSDTAEETKNE